jgi:hypothetical protein
MIAEMEADAAALVARIVGLQTAFSTARDIAERRRGRALTEAEHEYRNIKGVAVQHVKQPEEGTPPEALAAVGALTDRLRPGVWARIGEAIVQALHSQHETVEAKIIESVGAWRQFERDIREDSGAHFAGGK